MPRLLVITGELPLPSETFVVGHIRGMQERGWEVGVAANIVHADEMARVFGDKPPQTFELETRAAKIRSSGTLGRWWALRGILGGNANQYFTPTAGKRLRARAAALAEVARNFKPDAMHAHFGPHGLAAAPAARLFGIPLLVNYRGFDFLDYPATNGWEVYDALPPHTVAVGHTAFCENILRSHLKVRVEHVRRGVNRDRFNPPTRRDDWGSVVKLLTVGRLMFCKGHHLAIESLALLRKLKPDVRFELTLAGGGEMHDGLTAIAGALGVQDRVRLAGSLPHDKVGEEMRKADILLIPSLPRADGWVENFCTVASEGVASGLTVVASNNGGIPESVEGAGVLVEPGSAAALAEGIAIAMQQAGPAEWSKRALTKAARFQDSLMMDDYERVTREAIERGVSHD
ncbi:MAG: glycosyltransferase [Planctomycetes bacterium]|nr:glycosyltransferase [Planctomycetota bacterium]